MPLPTSMTILLSAASIGLIFWRSVPLRFSWARGLFFFMALILTAGSLWIDCVPSSQQTERFVAQGGVWNNDGLAQSEQWLVLLFSFLAGLAFFILPHDQRQYGSSSEFLLFVTAGMMLIARSNDLLSLGLSLEIVTLALLGLDRAKVLPAHDTESMGNQRPGGMIDHGLTWLPSACTWLGIAILSNVLATTHFEKIREVLTVLYDPSRDQTLIGTPSKLLLLATGLISLGLFARMGLVPFHLAFNANRSGGSYWRSGVSVAAAQLTGSIVLARLFGTVFVAMSEPLSTLTMTVCVASFVMAAVMAARSTMPESRSIPCLMVSLTLLQSAWLGIGLMITTLELQNPSVRWGSFVGQNETLSVIVFSQLAGLLACCGIYWTLGYLRRPDRELEFLEEIKGLWQFSPWMAVSLTLGLASSIGFPMTVGFWGRWWTLLAGHGIHLKSTSNVFAPHDGVRWTMFIGTIVSVAVAVVVVRLIRELFFESPLVRRPPIGGRGLMIASVIVATTNFVLGIAPQLIPSCSGLTVPARAGSPKGLPKGSGTLPIGSKDAGWKSTFSIASTPLVEELDFEFSRKPLAHRAVSSRQPSEAAQ